MASSILVVDDEPRLAETLALALEGGGLTSDFVTSAESALERVENGEFGLVITDLRMPGRNGRDLLHELRSRRPELPVVVMTAYASLRDAVALVKEGAFDYISKPFEIDDVIATARRALRLTQVVNENRRLRAELEDRYSFGNLIGSSPAFGEVLRQIAEVCESRATVLIQGESGTGKELVARAIHFNSPRRDNPFIAVNCSAIPENLLESELFGHAKGAFTGAVAAREGRFVTANGGTLFLDEIGNLPLRLQPKLLTVLEQRQVTPVGANAPVPVDIRVIAATNLPPEKLRDESHFRQDLLFRLNTVEIDLPPLRARREDVPQLITHYLQHYARRYGRPVPVLSPAARIALLEHDWPGNVRALRHALERAVILAREEALEPEDFALVRAMPRFSSAVVPPPPQHQPSDDLNLERVERRIVEEALKKHGYNISLSAPLREPPLPSSRLRAFA